jgi:NTE family protein
MNFIYKFILLISILVLAGCAGTSPNINIPSKMPPKLQISKAPTIGLVLGSGGARGYANAGVIEALHQNGIPINLIIGTSAGSIIGALYADNANIVAIKSILMNASFFDYADINNLPKFDSIISGYHLQKFLIKNMRSRSFKDLKIPLIVMATNVATGQSVAISSGPIAPAVNASAAIPGLIEPVKLYGMTLVDGGVTDPIAVDVAKKYGAKIIIAVNVQRKISNNIPKTALGMGQRAMDISLTRLAYYTSKGADILIHPKLNQGTFDLSDKKAIYNAGYQAGLKAIPKIKQMLLEYNNIHTLNSL